jgi:pimeloyl-ACP methyl ester carboxylesterase
LSRTEPDFVTGDGSEIACWRRGTGPPVLLVHGSGEDHARWERVVRALADRFTVHAMDRRGHGRSGDAGPHSLAAEADDIAAVLRRIGRPTHLIGHSYGALCCLEAAAAGADVGGLVLHEPCLPLSGARPPSAVATRLRALLDAGDREAVVTTFLREVIGAPPRWTKVLRALPTYPRLVGSADRLLRELVATEGYHFDGARLRGMETRVLLLAGREVRSPHVVAALSAIREVVPGARLVLLPAQAHLALDMAPLSVAAAVTEFLEVRSMPIDPVRHQSGGVSQ